jgi:hypothetical protein
MAPKHHHMPLIPACVGSHYIRHDERGDRTVTREAYAAEIAAIHTDRPDIRVVVYDHSFASDRAWFRFAFKWTDPTSGEPRSRAGMQSNPGDADTPPRLPRGMRALNRRVERVFDGSRKETHWGKRKPARDR